MQEVYPGWSTRAGGTRHVPVGHDPVRHDPVRHDPPVSASSPVPVFINNLRPMPPVGALRVLKSLDSEVLSL